MLPGSADTGYPVVKMQRLPDALSGGPVLRAVIVIAVIAAFVFIVMRVRAAIVEWRAGDLRAGERVRRKTGRLQREWRVVEKTKGNVISVSVEHPVRGIRRRWQIDASSDGADVDLARARADAAALVGELNEV